MKTPKQTTLAALAGIILAGVVAWLSGWLSAVFLIVAAIGGYWLGRGLPAEAEQALSNQTGSGEVLAEAEQLSQETIATLQQQIRYISDENQQIATLIHNAISKLTDSFQGMNEQTDSEDKMLHSLIDHDEQGQNFSDFIRETESVMNYLVDTVLNTSEESRQVMQKLEAMRGNVDGVISLLDDVKEITSKTNLRALNAAIEAARAGEADHGFAVVADEVRKLSKKSDAFSDEINDITMSVKSTLEDALKKVTDVVTADTNMAINSKNKVADISSRMTQLNDKTRQVISGTGEVSQSIAALVNQAVTSLQFEDMCSQLSQHIDRRLETVNDLTELMLALQQAQFQPDNLQHCKAMLDKVKLSAEDLQPRIAATQHKSVTQQTLDSGEIELF